jgi:hypothetical protein
MTKKVLIIGLNYSGALSGRINIAVNARGVFIADYGILEENITYLTDEWAPLTKAQIMTAIQTLIDASYVMDEIYIYYAGYGSGIRIVKTVDYGEVPLYLDSVPLESVPLESVPLSEPLESGPLESGPPSEPLDSDLDSKLMEAKMIESKLWEAKLLEAKLLEDVAPDDTITISIDELSNVELSNVAEPKIEPTVEVLETLTPPNEEVLPTEHIVLPTESILTESILTESILTESILTESILTESILTESILTESILTEPILTEPILTEPILTEPILTEPILTEPILTEPILTEPILTEPILTELEEPITYKYEFYPPNQSYDKLAKQMVASDYEIINTTELLSLLSNSHCRTICVLDMCPYTNTSDPLMWGTDIIGNVNIISFAESDAISSGKLAIIQLITNHISGP